VLSDRTPPLSCQASNILDQRAQVILIDDYWEEKLLSSWHRSGRQGWWNLLWLRPRLQRRKNIPEPAKQAQLHAYDNRENQSFSSCQYGSKSCLRLVPKVVRLLD
jgi:hypothetical protein